MSNKFSVTVLVAAVLAIGIFIKVPVQLQDVYTRKTTHWVNPVAARYVDCLWYAARNHGFYPIQRSVAIGSANEQSKQLWLDFIKSTAADECSGKQLPLSDVLAALETSVVEADAHFLSMQ